MDDRNEKKTGLEDCGPKKKVLRLARETVRRLDVKTNVKTGSTEFCTSRSQSKVSTDQ